MDRRAIMRRVDRWLTDWAESVIADTYRSDYSGINVVERILRDPGITTDLSQHKVLWWPKNKRVSWVSKAAHQLTPTERIILIIHYGHVLNDDGTRFTKKELAQNSSISTSRYLSIKGAARRKISRILDGYDKNGPDPA
jgi:hypothetical protein